MKTVWYLVKMFALWGLLAAAIYTDITAQMSFTENTRNGVYEAAYQKGLIPPP
jgi:hypothetical protein